MFLRLKLQKEIKKDNGVALAPKVCQQEFSNYRLHHPKENFVGLSHTSGWVILASHSFHLKA